MPKRPASTSAAASLFCLWLCGCAAPIVTSALQVAQYGSSSFSDGALETVFPQSYDNVALAVRQMVNDLGLVVDVDRPQDGFLYLHAEDLTKASVFIRVSRRARSLTSVHIRIGLLGDQPYSTALMNRVTANLDPKNTDPKAAPKDDPLLAPTPSAHPASPPPQ